MHINYMKKSILFFHFDLGNGGAERVLVNIANGLDSRKYDVTVKTLFNYGVNKDSLAPYIKREWVFDFKPFNGITKVISIIPAKFLHKLFVKRHYDIEVAFLEGSATKIISGCKDRKSRLFAWIHVEVGNKRKFFGSFLSMREALMCYHKFDGIACVSENTRDSFIKSTGWTDLNISVIHNVLEVDDIIKKSSESIPHELDEGVVNICSVGRLTEQKGYERLLVVLTRLFKEGINNWHLYLLGQGEKREALEQLSRDGQISDRVTFLGYVNPPYPYVAKMDLFVCSSYREGYSTAVSESVIMGTPVLTTECSGMREILGDGGKIVENSENGLYTGLKELLLNPNLIKGLKQDTLKRANIFSTSSAIAEFESFVNEN